MDDSRKFPFRSTFNSWVTIPGIIVILAVVIDVLLSRDLQVTISMKQNNGLPNLGAGSLFLAYPALLFFSFSSASAN